MPTIKQVPRIGVLPLLVHSRFNIIHYQEELDCPRSLQSVLTSDAFHTYRIRIRFLTCVNTLGFHVCKPAVFAALYSLRYSDYLFDCPRFNYSKSSFLTLLYQFATYSCFSVHQLLSMNKKTLLSKIVNYSLSAC